jgi:hypothetical protein
MPGSPSPDDVKWVGEQLEAGYIHLGLSRKKAAEKAHVDDRVWGRIEAGVREGKPYVPEAKTVVWAAWAVGIPAEPLLRRLGYPPHLAQLIPPPPEGDGGVLAMLLEGQKVTNELLREVLGRLPGPGSAQEGPG